RQRPGPAPGAGRPGHRHGRLQHRLRGAVLREAGADRAPGGAPAGAADPGRAPARPGPARPAAPAGPEPPGPHGMAGAGPPAAPRPASASTSTARRTCPPRSPTCWRPRRGARAAFARRGDCTMSASEPALRVGYVVKRYPCFSETFIVREILAHERAGLAIEIFSLLPTADSHFQDLLARVRAPVSCLNALAANLSLQEPVSAIVTANHFWRALQGAAAELPGMWTALEELREEEARTVFWVLALAVAVRRTGINHLHATFAHEACTVARLAARLAGVPYSFTARAKDIFHDTVRQEDLRRKLRDAAGVVTISDYHLDYLRATYGPLAAHVQRIYNGLNLDEAPY